MRVKKFVDFFHKASSYLAVAAALAAQASTAAAPATTWAGLAVAIAGAFGLPAVVGNLFGADKE